MTKDSEMQLKQFTKGFRTILPSKFISHLTPAELQLIIAGVPEVYVTDLKKLFNYENCCSDDPIAKWFWEILEEFNQEEMGQFLFFLSGKF